MKLYCRSCDSYTMMDYDAHTCNFICQHCNKLIVSDQGFNIIQIDNKDGDPELYITKTVLFDLMENGFLERLMKIYDERIYISSEE